MPVSSFEKSQEEKAPRNRYKEFLQLQGAESLPILPTIKTPPPVYRGTPRDIRPLPLKPPEDFDPEGSGYDYATARTHGLKPDETGHWPSRSPKTGQILKGQKHSTYHLTLEGEKKAGYEIYKGKSGRYYSKPTIEVPPVESYIPEVFDPSEPPDFKKPSIPYPLAETLFARPYLAAAEAVIPGARKGLLQIGARTPAERKQVTEWAEKIERLPWYKKMPEAYGWATEKFMEYKLLRGLFKYTGLDKLTGIVGEKLASRIAGKELAAMGGKSALLRAGGLNSFVKRWLTSVARTAPSNVPFISTWSASEAARRGEPIPPAAGRGALWGLGLTGGIAAVTETARGLLSNRAVINILAKLQTTHPKVADFLAGKPEEAFVDEALRQLQRDDKIPYGMKIGDLPKNVRSFLRAAGRIIRKQAIKFQQKQAEIEKYWVAPGPKGAKLAKVTPKPTIRVGEVPPPAGAITPEPIITPSAAVQPAPTMPTKPPVRPPVAITKAEPTTVAKEAVTKEATKYNTAKEFIESLKKFPVEKNTYLFHSSNRDLAELSKGTYFGNLEEAEDFLKTKRGKYIYVVKKSDVAPIKAEDMDADDDPFGYEWVKRGIAIRSKNTVVPIMKIKGEMVWEIEEQLTAIWKQAKPAPVEKAKIVPKGKVPVAKEIVLSAKKGELVIPPETEIGAGKRVGPKLESAMERQRLAIPKAKNVGAFLKRFALTIPEFTVEPVFTVEKDKQLVYRQFGQVYKLKPSAFGIDPEKLTIGQKVRIDLASYGIKPASKATLKKAAKLPFVRLPIQDKPSTQATAYKQPRPIQTEAKQEIAEAKQKARMEPGFARLPAIEDFKQISQKLKDNVAKINQPERDVVTDVFGAIEKWRAETNKAGLLTDWSKMTLEKMGVSTKAKDIITRYNDNPSAYQEQFDKLPDKAKQMAATLKADFEEMGKLAKAEGILDGWIDAYMPHVYKDSSSKLRRILYPTGGKLGTKFKFAKQRKIPNLDEAEKLGLHPITDPILLNSIYKYQLYRTIASKNLIELFKSMTREDGMKLIAGRPRKPDRLRVWENEYEWINHPALARFMYVGEAAQKPMLIKMSAKADPEVAKILNNIFSIYQPKGKLFGAYLFARGRIKRLIMMNPLIHGTNIFSDVMDEVGRVWPLRFVKATKAIRRGGELYKQKDVIVERMADAGVELRAGFGVARDLRKAMVESSETLRGIFEPIGKLEQWSDRVLWQGIVRNAQTGLFEILTGRLAQEHPNWSQAKIDKVVATHINTLLGTLPPTWFSKMGRTAGSVALFARNWTVSNIDLVVRAMTWGRKGLGVKALDMEQKSALGKANAKHLAKGIFGLIAFVNLMQFAFLTITNELKKRKLMKGQQVPLHTTFQNESWKHWIDVDTGFKTKTGQTVYLVAPFFRYIRDYFGWATQPAKTAYNKLEPLLKGTIEQLFNYSVWRQKNITPKGAPTWDKLKQRAKYFAESITPSQFYAHRPGRVKTPFEWVVPFSGTWIRRGAPGGKFSRLMWDFRSEQGYEKRKLDEKIDEMLQRGEFKEAIILMAEEERYATTKGMGMRFLEMACPLNYYWETTPKREKMKFLIWLRKEGYLIADLKKALEDERTAVGKATD